MVLYQHSVFYLIDTRNPLAKLPAGFFLQSRRTAMLVLSRRVDESIRIGDAVVTIISVVGGVVKVGIVAPPSVNILRTELIKQDSSDESRGL
jgi:carbon storage regulator CsrA